jgi:hypothetical protein
LQLKPLYSVRFRYPEAWDVEITGPGGVEEQDFLFAEGACTGALSGRFRLNDSICLISGEVRSPAKPADEIKQGDIELVFDVSELIWEAPQD